MERDIIQILSVYECDSTNIPPRVERWIVPFHEPEASEMEQSIFQRGVVYLYYHTNKTDNICFISLIYKF